MQKNGLNFLVNLMVDSLVILRPFPQRSLKYPRAFIRSQERGGLDQG